MREIGSTGRGRKFGLSLSREVVAVSVRDFLETGYNQTWEINGRHPHIWRVRSRRENPNTGDTFEQTRLYQKPGEVIKQTVRRIRTRREQ